MHGERADGVRAPSDVAAGVTRQLIVARLLDAAADVPRQNTAELMLPFDVERWLEGDVGHLHRAADLTAVPIASHRPLARRAVVTVKRTARRLLFPILDVQSGMNAANARVVTFLLEHVAAQARCIEELQRQVKELAERDR